MANQEITFEIQDFSVIKEKIIKTNELLLLFKEKSDKLGKATQAFRNVKLKYEASNNELNKLKIEIERLNFVIVSTKPQYEKDKEELTQLRSEYANLKDKYEHTLIDSQLAIGKLEESLKNCTCESEIVVSALKSPTSKVKDLKKLCRELRHIEKDLKIKNGLLIEKNEDLVERQCKIEKNLQETKSRNEELQTQIIFLQNKINEMDICLVEMKETKYSGESIKEKYEHEIQTINLEVSKLRDVTEKYNLLEIECDKLKQQIINKNICNTEKRDFCVQTDDNFNNITKINEMDIRLVAMKESNYSWESIKEKYEQTLNLEVSKLRDVTEKYHLLEIECDKLKQQIIHKKICNLEKRDFCVQTDDNFNNITKVMKKDSGIQVDIPLYIENSLNIDDEPEGGIEVIFKEMILPKALSPITFLEDELVLVNDIQPLQLSSKRSIERDKEIPNIIVTPPTPCVEKNYPIEMLSNIGDKIQSSAMFDFNNDSKLDEHPSHNDENNKRTNDALTRDDNVENKPLNNIHDYKNKLNTKKLKRRRKFWIPFNTGVFVKARKRNLKYIKPSKEKCGMQNIDQSDTILKALRALQQNNIAFTISNDSAPVMERNRWCLNSTIISDLSKNEGEVFQEEICCWNTNCLKENNYVLLRKVSYESEPEFLGFFSGGFKNNTVDKNNVSTENLMKELLNGVQKLVQNQEEKRTFESCRKKRSKLKSEFNFTSETETEIERLFKRSSDILSRNKKLLAAAKRQNYDSAGESNFESESEVIVDSGLVTATSKNDTDELEECTWESDIGIPRIKPHSSSSPNFVHDFMIKNNPVKVEYLIDKVPSMLSPIASSKGSPEKALFRAETPDNSPNYWPLNFSDTISQTNCSKINMLTPDRKHTADLKSISVMSTPEVCNLYSNLNEQNTRNHDNYSYESSIQDESRINLSIQTADLNYSLKDINISQLECSPLTCENENRSEDSGKSQGVERRRHSSRVRKAPERFVSFIPLSAKKQDSPKLDGLDSRTFAAKRKIRLSDDKSNDKKVKRKKGCPRKSEQENKNLEISDTMPDTEKEQNNLPTTIPINSINSDVSTVVLHDSQNIIYNNITESEDHRIDNTFKEVQIDDCKDGNVLNNCDSSLRYENNIIGKGDSSGLKGIHGNTRFEIGKREIRNDLLGEEENQNVICKSNLSEYDNASKTGTKLNIVQISNSNMALNSYNDCNYEYKSSLGNICDNSLSTKKILSKKDLFGEDISDSSDSEGSEHKEIQSTQKIAKGKIKPNLKRKILNNIRGIPYLQSKCNAAINKTKSSANYERAKKNMDSNKKINIIQNILISSGKVINRQSNSECDINEVSCLKKPSKIINADVEVGGVELSSFSTKKKKIESKLSSNNTPDDILTRVMQDMRKNNCKSQNETTSSSPDNLKSEVRMDTRIEAQPEKNETEIEEIPDCPKSPDIMEVPSSQTPKLIPINKPLQLPPSKVKILIDKLMFFSNEEKILNEIALEFAYQDVKYLVEIVLSKLSTDYHDKADNLYPPSPAMTPTQRIMLGFLTKLDKTTHPGILIQFLDGAEEMLFNRNRSSIEIVQPIARLYTAICKLKKDINRMRRFICEGFYFMGNLGPPILFTVLTIWAEVLPMESEVSDHNLIAKVIVQLCYLKGLNEPGYNFAPLKDLLQKYFGYPRERYSCEDIFRDILVEYIRCPSKRLSDFTLLVFLKNKPTGWVHQKIKDSLLPLFDQIPDSNVNLKGTILILLANICCGLNKYETEDWKVISEMDQWLENLGNGDLDPVTRRSIKYARGILPRKSEKKKNQKTSKELELNKNLNLRESSSNKD
ncbi:uncharacterized protein LOC115883738 isoform X2 [Sitophilus oryzae]|uniref:Uncharacterized protein LOC115883738 isoform X2 n=1 Tax=Sitophilus oryzae TaxID=7048 RepID=A0A6J2Y4U8_SITOR|nr:uncharacterized protein LOC115883738 isoform X2 [Sitophilus oryzae]